MTKKISYREYLYRMGLHNTLKLLIGEKSFSKRVKFGRIWWSIISVVKGK